MAGWRDAVTDGPGGVRIDVEVAAGARADRFPDGWNPWRGRIGVRVREPAVGGRANAAVVGLVARRLGVPAARVAVEAGTLDSRKGLRVAGLAAADVQRLLAADLDTAQVGGAAQTDGQPGSP